MIINKTSTIETYRLEVGDTEFDLALGEDLPATIVDATVVDGKLVDAQVFHATDTKHTLLAVWTQETAPTVLLDALGLS